jgi:hypothetical protein
MHKPLSATFARDPQTVHVVSGSSGLEFEPTPREARAAWRAAAILKHPTWHDLHDRNHYDRSSPVPWQFEKMDSRTIPRRFDRCYIVQCLLLVLHVEPPEPRWQPEKGNRSYVPVVLCLPSRRRTPTADFNCLRPQSKHQREQAGKTSSSWPCPSKASNSNVTLL